MSGWGAPPIGLNVVSDPPPPVPTPAVRLYSFTAWTNTNPTKPQPGDALDAEFDYTDGKINDVADRLAVIQRDDGGLMNSIVTMDSISPEAIADLSEEISNGIVTEVQAIANQAAASADAAEASAEQAASTAAALPPLPGTPGQAVIVAPTGTAFTTQDTIPPASAVAWNIGNRRLATVGAPVQPGDAATKIYVDDSITAAGGVPIPPAAAQVLTSTGAAAGAFAWAVPDVTDAELTAVQNALNAAKADKAITLSSGTGLTGGGDLSANRSFRLADMPALTVKGNLAAAPGVAGDVTIANLQGVIQGRLLRAVVFNLAGAATYNRNPAASLIRVQLLGGGGAGGGCAVTGAGQCAAAGGGGAGGYVEKFIDNATIDPTTALVVGAGGVPAAVGANAGGSGVATQFGILFAALGGGGGGGSTAFSTIGASGIGGNGAAGVGGDVNCAGNCGHAGLIFPSTLSSLSGAGGGSVFAGAAKAVSGNGPGLSAPPNCGGGGSGAASLQSVAARAGGAGGSGIIIIWEFS